MRPAVGGESCHKIHRTQGRGWAPGRWCSCCLRQGWAGRAGTSKERSLLLKEVREGGAILVDCHPGKGKRESRKPPLLGQGRAEIRFGEEHAKGTFGEKATHNPTSAGWTKVYHSVLGVRADDGTKIYVTFAKEQLISGLHWCFNVHQALSVQWRWCTPGIKSPGFRVQQSWVQVLVPPPVVNSQ